MNLLGAGRRGSPSGEAFGSSRRGELRGRVGLSRSLPIDKPVITTDPLIVNSAVRWRSFFAVPLEAWSGACLWLMCY
jgi:hypothetical protein